tara:strand:- start:116 stop:1372 length:1257 start_codon:yes stop_codon:yes gene_type:complete
MRLIIDLLKLSALPVVVTGAVLGADFPALAELYTVPSFEQVGQYGVGKYSAAEIVASDGNNVIAYTNSDQGSVDFVNIEDPSSPTLIRSVSVGGEPTSVAIHKGYAYVAVNTSESYTQPSGKFLLIEIKKGKVIVNTPLEGQPDSVAVAPDGSFAAIAIENQRNEDIRNAKIPQYPAGNLAMVRLPSEISYIDLRGLAEIAPSDPEPEFVDINENGEIVVTLQENNHIAVVSAEGEIINHFSAGKVDLYDIDIFTNGYYKPNGSRQGVRREPDGVKWIDNDHFVTANEGDYKIKRPGEHKRGGSRGFTIFNKDGSIVYDPGNTFENALAKAGFWNDKRAGKKGVEPENVEVTGNLLFVGAERVAAVGVFDISDLSNPELIEILPVGERPEGLVAIPNRRLFISANEKDAKNSLSIFKY